MIALWDHQERKGGREGRRWGRVLHACPPPYDILPPLADGGQFLHSPVTSYWIDGKHPAGECSEPLHIVWHHVVYYAAIHDAILLLYTIAWLRDNAQCESPTECDRILFSFLPEFDATVQWGQKSYQKNFYYMWFRHYSNGSYEVHCHPGRRQAISLSQLTAHS